MAHGSVVSGQESRLELPGSPQKISQHPAISEKAPIKKTIREPYPHSARSFRPGGHDNSGYWSSGRTAFRACHAGRAFIQTGYQVAVEFEFMVQQRLDQLVFAARNTRFDFFLLIYRADIGAEAAFHALLSFLPYFLEK
jgi:hypothetical protein